MSPKDCLLLHGLTGSPQEFGDLPSVLKAQGYNVISPLLSGHGKTIEDLAKVRFTDWQASVTQALEQFSAHAQIIVIGSSLGALLALDAVNRFPNRISKMILLAPPLGLKKSYIEFLLSGLTRVSDKLISKKWVIPKSKHKKDFLAIPHQAYEKHSIVALRELFKLRRKIVSHANIPETRVIVDPKDYNLNYFVVLRKISLLFQSHPEKLTIKTIQDAGHELLLGHKRAQVLELIMECVNHDA